MAKRPLAEARRLRTSKGRRPWFFENSEVDQILSMVMALAGEVSVLRDRLDSVEKIAAGKGLFTSADVDAYEPGAEVEAERDAARAAFLDRVLRILQEELDDVRYREEDREYERIISGVAVE
ncbi:MAG: hypothetical protein RLN77_09140 [Rhodospirillales bacterium]